ncbi:thiamine pyrophosphate-binding protein [Starkeya sp. ORNL1]|uniref:thiamine pyrophosphate-binding protein n=1 Tax=Starkeya sp. ORNL1 TaxID=2709380 RepID=UPI00197D4E8F|nr:thiamine pyrophosphate-binding protein [Starkeya sp. ORNL1]
MPQKSGSRIFAEFLADSGVTHVFFLPAIMLKGLAEMEDLGIRRVMVHGEKASAYMADGYARASGRPGICMAQYIGASNLSAGLRDAKLASSPVIAITGGPTPSSRYRHAYQELEDFTQFDPVTKFNARVDDARRLPDLLRQAFREATSGCPGPAHLQIAGPHAQVAEGRTDLDTIVEQRFTRVPAFRPEPEPEAIREAARLLSRATRPVIVAGGGVISSGAAAEVLALAEALNIPLATSMNAKGTIVDDHRLSAGVVGTYSRGCANRTVVGADLVLFIGSHTGGQVTHNWQVPPRGTRVIQIDIDPAELGRNYVNAVSVLGDAKVATARLLDVARGEPQADRSGWIEEVGGFVKQWRAEMEPFLSSSARPMRPERICRAIGETLPPDGVVVTDTGHSGIWSSTMIDLRHPTQRFIRCAGSMGWGFPGSLGVKCALPDRPVLCWSGDGAFYYHIAELETAARYGINVVTVVNNNSSLNQEIPLFDKAYGGEQRGRADEMWRHSNINFAKVAESFGCVGMRVEDPRDLDGALREAYAANRPVVIDAVSDERAMAKQPWLP